jgi:cyanophycin synthetase
MRIDTLKTFSGPNVYSQRATTLLVVELSPDEERGGAGASSDIETIDRVAAVAEELLRRADIAPLGVRRLDSFGPARPAIAVDHVAEHATRFVLESAVAACRLGTEADLDAIAGEARRVAARTELGPSTRALVEAAERRSIPWMRIGEGSLVQLGYGAHRRLLQAAMTSATSCIAADIASDKQLAKSLLEIAEVPVPRGIVVSTADEAARALDELEPPLVVKPCDGRQGQGVVTGLECERSVKAAFEAAREYSSRVIVEEMLSGRDYRVLVVGGRVVAASERTAAHVVGDGAHTIEQLVEISNKDPRRGDGHAKPLTKLALDLAALACLEREGLTPQSVPEAGRAVILCGSANLSKGGVARDVTDDVHPAIADVCERAARAVGLDVCGVDLIAEAIDRPLAARSGVVEVNAAPGLRMHLHPSEGSPRDVASAILETIYPEGAPSRIPIIAVTGTNGKTTTTRMIAHVMARSGPRVGMTTTDGIWIDGREVARGDTTGPVSARTVLSDPAVEVAVLETARGGIVRRGLGYDWSDVGVITNVQMDHLGQDGIASVDDLLAIKRIVADRVAPGGTIVLNADDERLAMLPSASPELAEARRLALFSLHESSIVVRGHVARGGVAYVLRPDGWIVELEGERERRVVDASRIPITLGGTAEYHIANAMAAVAACRARGLDVDTIARALHEFGAERNEGRTNLYAVGDAYVLVDYGHNPGAYEALAGLARRWAPHPTTCILSVPGDRWDAVVVEIGSIAGCAFDRVVISEDEDLRGRRPGEVAALLEGAIQAANPSCDYRISLDRNAAFAEALDAARPGEILLMLYEELGPIRDELERRGAVAVTSISSAVDRSRLTA